MVKEVTQVELVRYVAVDGETFTNEEECLQHEDALKSRKLKCFIRHARSSWSGFSRIHAETRLHSLHSVFVGTERVMWLRIYSCPCKGVTAMFKSPNGSGESHKTCEWLRENIKGGSMAMEITAVVQHAMLEAGIKFNQDITRRRDTKAGNSAATESIHFALMLAAKAMKLHGAWISSDHFL